MQNVLEMKLTSPRQVLCVFVEMAIIQGGFFLPAKCGLRIKVVPNCFTVLANVGQWPVVFVIERVRKLLRLCV